MKTILLALGYWLVVSCWIGFAWSVYVTIQRRRRTKRVVEYVMATIGKGEPVTWPTGAYWQLGISPTYGIRIVSEEEAKGRGWIAESRFHVEGETDQAIIAKLLEESK